MTFTDNPPSSSPWVFENLNGLTINFESGIITFPDYSINFQDAPRVISFENITNATVILPEQRIDSWVSDGISLSILDNVQLNILGNKDVGGGSHRVAVQLDSENFSYSLFDYSTGLITTNSSNLFVQDPNLIMASHGDRHLAIGGFGIREFMFPSDSTAVYFQLDPRSTFQAPRSHFDNDKFLRFGLNDYNVTGSGTIFDHSLGAYFDLLNAVGVGNSLMSLTNLDDVYWGSTSGLPKAIEPSKGNDILISRNGQDVLTLWDSYQGTYNSSSVNLLENIAIDGYGDRNQIEGFRFFESAYNEPFYFTGDSTDSVIQSWGVGDIITGGIGNETYGVYEYGISYDLMTGQVTDADGTLRATLSNIENIYADGPVSVTGNNGDNIVFAHTPKGGLFSGNGGNDSLVFTRGLVSPETVFDGGAGIDRIYVYAPVSEIEILPDNRIRVGATPEYQQASQAYGELNLNRTYDVGFSRGTLIYNDVEYIHGVDGTINLRTGTLEPLVSFDFINAIVDPALFRVNYFGDEFSQIPNSPIISWFSNENSLNNVDHQTGSPLITGSTRDHIVNRGSAPIESGGGDDRILSLGSNLDLTLGYGDDIAIIEAQTAVSGSIRGGEGTDSVIWQKYADYIVSESNVSLDQVELILVLDRGLMIKGDSEFELSAALVLEADQLNVDVSEKLRFVGKRAEGRLTDKYYFVDDDADVVYSLELEDSWVTAESSAVQLESSDVTVLDSSVARVATQINLGSADGVDRLILNADLDEISLSSADQSTTITWNDDSYFLLSVERIQLSETNLAIDFDGSAGQTAKTLAAVIGEEGLSNKEYVGIGLQLFDAGQSLATVCELALTAVGATTNEAVVNLLYTNLYGEAPTADVAQPFIDALNNGGFTKGSLAAAAAELTDDLGVIDLVGLAETGIEYV